MLRDGSLGYMSLSASALGFMVFVVALVLASGMYRMKVDKHISLHVLGSQALVLYEFSIVYFLIFPFCFFVFIVYVTIIVGTMSITDQLPWVETPCPISKSMSKAAGW